MHGLGWRGGSFPSPSKAHLFLLQLPVQRCAHNIPQTRTPPTRSAGDRLYPTSIRRSTGPNPPLTPICPSRVRGYRWIHLSQYHIWQSDQQPAVAQGLVRVLYPICSGKRFLFEFSGVKTMGVIFIMVERKKRPRGMDKQIDKARMKLIAMQQV